MVIGREKNLLGIDLGPAFQPWDQIFTQLFDYICYLVEIIRPTELLYIAVDGTSPMAKMQESRKRRLEKDAEMREQAPHLPEYKRVYEREFEGFDTANLMPGTQFMTDMCRMLIESIK